MSAVIRLQLATVLSTLKVKGRAVLTALNAQVTTVEDDDRLEADAVQLREAAGRAQALVDKWSDFIARLMPTEQQDEMDILQAFPPPRGEVRVDDEPTALAQIEHAYELVDLVNVCLRQRRTGNHGSVSSRRTEKSATVGKEQTDNGRHQAQHTQDNGQENYSPEHPEGFVRRQTQTRITEQQAARNGTSTHHTNSASQAGFSPYQQQGTYNGAPIYSTFRPFRLEPIKFAGDPKEWTAFWLAFDRAVNSQPLPPFEKHLCLLQSLVPGSAAHRAIDVANNSLYSLRDLRANVERICLQLESPEGSNATQDEIVCGIIRSKLPREVLETLIDWEQDDDEWTLAHLRAGLGRIVQRKERLERTITNLRPAMPERRPREEEQRQRSQPQDRYPQHRPAQISRSFVTVQPAGNRYERRPLSPPPFTGKGCSLCIAGPEHLPSQCTTWNTPQKRQMRLLEQHRCLNCLRDDHLLNQCQSVKRCRVCKGRHHFIVCMRQGTIGREAPRIERQPTTTTNIGRATGANSQPLGQSTREVSPLKQASTTHTGMASDPTIIDEATELKAQPTGRPRALLMVTEVVVRPIGARNRQATAVVFFDPGSQTSFISGSLVRQLGLKSGHSEKMRVHVLGGEKNEPLCFDSARYKLQLKRYDDQWEGIELNYIEEIAAQMETPKCIGNDDSYNYVLRMDIGKPHILIGTREFWKYFIDCRMTNQGYTIIRTVLGPVLGGEASLPGLNKTPSSLMAVNSINQEQMPSATTIEEFWSLETIGIKDDPAQDDDQLAEKMVEQSIRQLEDGRYCVKWPWRDPCPELPSNFAMAYRRLVATLNRLRNEPDQLKKYNEVICEQQQQGIIELTSCSPGNREHYLPHHAVITPKKLRVVYDASAHPKGQACLNDCLYRGPVLLPDLAGVLLRFRNCAIPVLADVEKAFLMIELEPEDREVCKFLWAKDPMQPPTGENLAVYRFCRVAFGVVSSPFMLAAVIRAHLAKFGPEQDAVLFRNVYVDNLLIECENVDEARTKAVAAKEVFKQAKMNLREYISSSTDVMSALPEEDKLQQKQAKVLGITWDVQSDEVLFELPAMKSNSTITRRTVLSVLAGIFDPLGLIGPCTLEAKKFFQKLWDESHGWDTELSIGESEHWKRICADWNGSIIRQERFVLGQNTDIQIHVFTDASEASYAAAVYLRSESKTRLVFSKVRLTPRKAREKMTIPRMELMGVLLGVRATAFVSAQIHRSITATHLWCDSQIVLAWIKSKETQPVFVENRLREIRKQENMTFHYVNTSFNPADVATRGTTAAQLMNTKLWWNGPIWINAPSDQWPHGMEFNLPLNGEVKQDENSDEQFVGVVNEVPAEPIFDAKRFSSLLTLLGTVILVLRFIKLRCVRFPTCISTTGIFTANDYRIARSLLIRLAQREHKLEMKSIHTVIDSEGIIRIKTRIDKNAESCAPVNPIWLPRHAGITSLIILDVHQRLKHAGVDWTLTEVLREFFLPQARRTTKQILSQCSRCRLMNKPKYALPIMPPLPADRVQRRRPFESVGLDYLGPTLARQAGVVVKVWIVIITCLSVRAVYLEPTYDLSAPSFINVLRRFISRRGKPRRILSDNAPTFVQTVKALKTLAMSDDPAEFSARSGIDWHFIPQLSPWAGGVYERLVALVKHSIQRTLGRRILPCDDLSAFLTEAEASINSRPLTTVSDAEGAPMPLRPMDFLLPGADMHLATTQLEDDEDKRLPSHEKLAIHWRATQEAVEYYWTRWTKEYLLVLRERAGWTHRGPRSLDKSIPMVGDVVLIEEDLRPRNLWSLGRITELNGQEPNIRSAKVLMANGKILTRPINRLCPLETSKNVEIVIPTTPDPVKEPSPQRTKLKEKKDNPPKPPCHNMITRARARMDQAGTTAAVTSTSFLDAGKSLSVSQAGITGAATAQLNTKCSSVRKISTNARQQEGLVAECRPSPKARKRGISESALHHHRHRLGRNQMFRRNMPSTVSGMRRNVNTGCD
uniref:Integrase catalytic domain-containing protein n=1 Tax=Meloidogyne enterolobii TaxID=390850 RepID=A0A6V7VMW3_MELEN|nr:unnamed protein product [Meloidogyne enterolobii]